MYKRLNYRVIAIGALLLGLTATACNEPLLPPVAAGSAPGGDAVLAADAANASDTSAPADVAEPATPANPFVEPPAPRFDPTHMRTPEQKASQLEKIKNGEDFMAVELLPNVKVVSQAVADAVDVSPTAMSLPKKGNEALLQLPAGAVLTGGAAQAGQRRGGSGDNAFGFMRKVKSVKEVDGKIVIETEQARLAEVFAGAVNLSADLTAAEDVNVEGIDLRDYWEGLAKDYQPLSQRGGGWSQRSGAWGKDGMLVGNQLKLGGEHAFPIDLTQKIDGVDVTVDGELKLKAILEAELGVGYGFDIDTPFPDVWNSSLNYIRLWAGGGFHAEAGVWLQAAAKADALSEKIDEVLEIAQLDNPFKPSIPEDYTLYTYGPKKGPMLWVVPTTYYIEFIATCNVHLSSSIQATANAGMKGELKYGYEWTKKNKFQPIQKKEFKQWYEFKMSDGSATAVVTCTVGPRFHWMIGGVAGPYVDARAGVRSTFGYDATCPDPKKLAQSDHPSASVSVLVELGLLAWLGGSMKFGDDYEYDFGNVKLFEFWFKLWGKTFYDIGKGLALCPSTCENGVEDNGEMGVDCGGGLCKGCPPGSPCTHKMDCSGGMNCAYGVCSSLDQTDPCNDGKQGPSELDVDCGGSCGKCKSGQKCGSNDDCVSELCQEATGKCSTWDCVNGVHDLGGETDVDCGGNCKGPPYNKKCKLSHKCVWDDDCESGVCFAPGDPNQPSWCIAAECKSFKSASEQGSETGSNCGGPCADQLKVPATACFKGNCGLSYFKCPVGQGCKSNADCAGGNCIAATGLCGAAICVDGVQDGDETDKDCGGSCKSKCAHGKGCASDADCGKDMQCSNWSTYSNTFAGGSKCVYIDENGKKDAGIESDVDCGAGVNSKCGDGKTCNSGADCVGGGNGAFACLKPVYGPQVCMIVGDCSDGVADGVEADVDCGTACNAKCAAGKYCFQDADCQDGACYNCKNGQCTPALPQFGVKGVCQGTCNNYKLDPGEADVDCGGPDCAASCWTGAHCTKNEQCTTGFCAKAGPQWNWKCAVSSCVDKALGPDEADSDCGGVCTTKCNATWNCKVDGDCKSNVCTAGKCTFALCENLTLDPGEMGVDCGGTCPQSKCPENSGCAVDMDCALGQCLAGKCHFDPCQNGKLDSAEADLDCGNIVYQSAGWKCSKCGLGKACKVSADCKSGICATAGKCVATACEDGLWSAGEGGVDCGGNCAAKCGAGATCIANGDCVTGFCATMEKCGSGYCAVPAKCALPACDDGVKNGSETDLDCGGPCKPCLEGYGCTAIGDCVTQICGNGKCQPPLCSNGVQDPGEVDADCGGPCQYKCTNGKKCSKGADCENGQCLKTGVCGYDPCQNGNKDGSETGVDCGGSCPDHCALAEGCKVGKDCASGFCDGTQCVASACSDKQLTPGEADVDCGGPCSTKCATGKPCKGGSDCASTFCDGSVCVTTACADKKLSPGETDVDCGGNCAAHCGLKQGCKAGGDCQSNVCDGAVCVAGSCWDKLKTDNEGDVDCGGACAAKCSTGKKCGKDADCTSSVCSTSGACVVSHCDDGKLSGNETDVDCGGSCATQCLVAAKCKVDADCFSGACAVKDLKCVSTACFDQAQDKGESDVDCGGPCKPCTIGQQCATDPDCNSEACAGQPAAGEVCDMCLPTLACGAGKCALIKEVCPDDGNACTVEACNSKTGACSATAKVCDDGNVCTNDSCVPASGCSNTANNAPCPDSDACTISEVCANKICSKVANSCNDNNACTIDSCDSVKGCVNVADNGKCNDGLACTADSCNVSTGLCVYVPNNGACDDGNGCTTDACAAGAGCTHANNTAPCPDSDACTTNEVCSGGTCQKTAVVCNDGVECTSDACNPSSGCTFATKSAGSTCSAGVCKGTTCCASSSSITTLVYNGSQGGPDGSPQYYSVPACATWVYVKARGGNGASLPANPGNQGGLGHTAWGYMSGLENKTLIVKVAGAGGALGGQYGGNGAIPGYNGGGADTFPNMAFSPTGTRGGGGATSVQLAETTYGPDQVLVAGGGGGSSTDPTYSGRSGGDGGSPVGKNGVGAGTTAGTGAFGVNNPGFGGVNPIYGQKGNGDYFMGGRPLGWGGIGGGGGGGGYAGGGAGVTSCDQGPPAYCSQATASGGGGGGGLTYYGNNMQKTGSDLTGYNPYGTPHGFVQIQWFAGPNVP